MKNNKRKIWESPWSYKEGWIISASLLIIGFFLEYVTKNSFRTNISWPTNFYILLAIVAITVSAYIFGKHSKFIKWACSIPAAITAVTVFTVLTLAMGFTIQDSSANSEIVNALGLSDITHSWPFILSQIYLLTTLGMVILKRIIPINIKNIGFTLNHLGLWIAVSAGVLGSGDLIRLTMDLHENDTNWIAKDESGNSIELPIAFELKDFSLEEYNPKMGLVDNISGELIHKDGKNLYLVDNKITCNIDNYKITVDTFYNESGFVFGRYVPVNDIGAAPAALVHITNTVTGDTISDWISCGSFRMPYKSVKLDSVKSLLMIPPEPKKFTSDVKIFTQEGNSFAASIEVNKPVKVQDWEVYQLSYNDEMGKWSSLSVIELVKDPWLNVVYTGIYMMIIGGLFLFWKGKKNSKTE